MANLYTKTGDKGETSLYGGSRVSKDSLKVECYGTVDEANSMLGLGYALSDNQLVREKVNEIQKRLFTVGAELASDAKGAEMLQGKITEEDVTALERIVDDCTKVNGKQTGFVVPGVNPPSAAFHSARTIIRRAERNIISLGKQEPVRPELLRYVNRLSDTIYALARLEETCEQLKTHVENRLSFSQSQTENKSGSGTVTGSREESAEDDDLPSYTLNDVKRMAEAAERKAAEMCVPIVFSAVDEGGNLMLLHRMEQSLLASVDLSINKAYTALALKMSTDQLAEYAAPGKELYGVQHTNRGKIVVFGGGYPIRSQGKVAGAIGVSGGSVEQDMIIAAFAKNARVSD